jgi:hypothetical protein
MTADYSTSPSIGLRLSCPPAKQLAHRGDRVRDVLELLPGLLAVHGSKDLTRQPSVGIGEAQGQIRVPPSSVRGC